MNDEIIGWLLAGDISIRYQARRDLLGEERPDLQSRISEEGWGARLLSKRRAEGHWGKEFYQPKWTSTHYTVLDLKSLQVSPDCDFIRQSVAMIAAGYKGEDGGISWDERMAPACEVLLKKRRIHGRWPLQAKIPGQAHFEMEKPGQPSRCNTMRASRAFQAYPMGGR